MQDGSEGQGRKEEGRGGSHIRPLQFGYLIIDGDVDSEHQRTLG
jgi:hypothetical protein